MGTAQSASADTPPELQDNSAPLVGNQHSGTNGRGHEPVPHRSTTTTRHAFKPRSKAAGKGSPRPRLDEAPYDLTIQIRGAKKTGKTSLRKRLCGEEFDFSHYAPTVATEEAVFDWIYYSPQGQVEVSVPVKIADVVDLDADGGDPNAVILLVNPHSRESLKYMQRHAAGLSAETPLLIIYNFRDLVDEHNDAAVSFEDVLTVAHEIRIDRLKARQRRALQLQGLVPPDRAEELMLSIQADRYEATELSERGDLLVNVLEASMSNCFGLLALQQYLEIPLRNKQRRLLEEKIKLARSSLQSGHSYYDLSRSKYSYEDYIQMLHKSDTTLKRGNHGKSSGEPDAKAGQSGVQRGSNGHGSHAHIGAASEETGIRHISVDQAKTRNEPDALVSNSDSGSHRKHEIAADDSDNERHEKSAADSPIDNTYRDQVNATMGLSNSFGVSDIALPTRDDLNAFLDESSDEEGYDGGDRRIAHVVSGATSAVSQNKNSEKTSSILQSVTQSSAINEELQVHKRVEDETGTGDGPKNSARTKKSSLGRVSPSGLRFVSSGREELHDGALARSDRRSNRKREVQPIIKEPPETPVLAPGVIKYSRLKRPVRKSAMSDLQSTEDNTQTYAEKGTEIKKGCESDNAGAEQHHQSVKAEVAEAILVEETKVRKQVVVAEDKYDSEEISKLQDHDGDQDSAIVESKSEVECKTSYTADVVAQAAERTEIEIDREISSAAGDLPEVHIDSFKQDAVPDDFFDDSDDNA